MKIIIGRDFSRRLSMLFEVLFILLWEQHLGNLFGGDMILPIEYQADWNVITQRKQRRIDQSNACKNSKWIDIEYSKGDNVLLNRPGILPKLAIPCKTPYRIKTVHDNGTMVYWCIYIITLNASVMTSFSAFSLYIWR